MIYRLPLLLTMVSGFTNLFAYVLIKHPSHRMSPYNVYCWARGYGSVSFSQTLPVCCAFITLPSSMAPVVRIEPNGIQTLLSYDDAREDLERNGRHVFIRKFQGFNLRVAQEFTLSFDSCREKVGDVQLEVT
jgi:hypothetical protein